MRRVLLIAAISACAATQPPPSAGPTSNGTSERVASPPLPTPPPAGGDSLWDRGTFIEVHKGSIAANAEERFQIWQTPRGYRLVIAFERTTRNGDPSDGEATLETDFEFNVFAGEMRTTTHLGSRDDTVRSRIVRLPDGRLETEVNAADGTTERAASRTANDWYIGGPITTFLVALCQVDASRSAPTVYPDKETTLEPPQPLPIEGSGRGVTFRRLTYKASRWVVVAACEDGKLAGEITGGITRVRKGDLALARVLEARFR